MTQSNEVADDLRFVRAAVEKRDQKPHAINSHLIIWAIYSLVCVPAYDFLPRQGLAINLIGFAAAMTLSGIMGKRAVIQSGQYDKAEVSRTMLHWYGGIALLLVATFGLAIVNPAMRNLAGSQVSVILVGFLYFTAGVHMPEMKFMRWAGPIIVIAGIGMALLPHYRNTAMGLIFAACLLSPLLFSRRAADRT